MSIDDTGPIPPVGDPPHGPDGGGNRRRNAFLTLAAVAVLALGIVGILVATRGDAHHTTSGQRPNGLFSSMQTASASGTQGTGTISSPSTTTGRPGSSPATTPGSHPVIPHTPGSHPVIPHTPGSHPPGAYTPGTPNSTPGGAAKQGSGTHGGNQPPPVYTPPRQTTAHRPPPPVTHSTTHHAPPPPPPSSTHHSTPPPAPRAVPVSGDGGMLSAINSYRTSHGLKAVNGGYSSSTANCAARSNPGSCTQYGAWGSSSSQSASGGMTVLEADNMAMLRDPNLATVYIGWARWSDGNGYVVDINGFTGGGGWS